MSNIQNNIQPNKPQGLGSTHSVGAAQSSGSQKSGDELMYKAMMALTLELETLSDAQTSVAKLSTALYDHMLPNATNRLKDMQRHLDDYTWLQEHFEAFEKYFKGKGPMPELGPGMSKGDLAIMKSFYGQHPTLTGARMAITGLAQSIGVQNTYISDEKALPTSLENNVQALANDKTQVAMQIVPILALMKRPYYQPW